MAAPPLKDGKEEEALQTVTNNWLLCEWEEEEEECSVRHSATFW